MQNESRNRHQMKMIHKKMNKYADIDVFVFFCFFFIVDNYFFDSCNLSHATLEILYKPSKPTRERIMTTNGFEKKAFAFMERPDFLVETSF